MFDFQSESELLNSIYISFLSPYLLRGKKKKEKKENPRSPVYNKQTFWILSLVSQMNEEHWQPLGMLEEDFVES